MIKLNAKILISMLLTLFLWSSTPLIGQDIFHTKREKVDKKSFENVKSKKLYSDRYSSSFMIYIKKDVPLHIHENHDEHVFVIDGKGILTLAGKKIKIGKGDLVIIPRNTPHGVVVKGRKPMRVLSIQAPEFKGHDRVLVDQN